MDRLGLDYTDDELKRAERLKYQMGMSWEEVANELRRPMVSLTTVVHRERTGKRKGIREATHARRELFVQDFEAGMTMAAIARKHGLSTPAVCQGLTNLGYDPEMRQEYRREHRPPPPPKPPKRPSSRWGPDNPPPNKGKRKPRPEPVEPVRKRSADWLWG